MPASTLVVVSGPPGTGKTTLAHALAPLIPCPAICRDEIKEGMAHAEGPDFGPGQGDPLTMRTVSTFAETIRVLVAAGVSLVAEAAFQDQLWRRVLEPVSDHARLRLVQCSLDAGVAWERAAQRRAPRAAHAVGGHVHDLEKWTEWYTAFDRVSLAAPSIEMDTTDGTRRR